MKSACESMKTCADNTSDIDAKERYDKVHKSMVRLLREWNKTEQARGAQN